MFNIIFILMLIGLPGHCETIQYIDLETGKLIIGDQNDDMFLDLDSGDLKIQHIEDGYRYDFNNPDESGLILEVE